MLRVATVSSRCDDRPATTGQAVPDVVPTVSSPSNKDKVKPGIPLTADFFGELLGVSTPVGVDSTDIDKLVIELALVSGHCSRCCAAFLPTYFRMHLSN